MDKRGDGDKREEKNRKGGSIGEEIDKGKRQARGEKRESCHLRV